MSDIILGARIELKTDGVAASSSVASTSIKRVGDAAKQTQAQMAALSRQAQATARSVTEGYKGLGAALGMDKAAITMYQKTVVDAQKAWAELSRMGERQYRKSTVDPMAQQMAASAKATQESLASIYRGSERLGASYFQRLKLLFEETRLGAKKLADDHEKATTRMVKANEKVGWSMRGWLPHIRTAGAAIGVYMGVRSISHIIRLADSFTEMGARLRLVSGNTRELQTAQEGLFKIAQANRAPLQDMVNLYFKLGTSMRDMGASQQDVLKTVDTVGKAMRISGASTIEISAAMQQLAQAFAKGKLDGDEFRSVMENAPRLMKALTDEFKISKGELYQWSETGRLSVEKMMQAIKNQAGVIEQEFTTIPVTIMGAWQQVTNALSMYIGGSEGATKGSKNLAEALGLVAKNLNLILDPIAAFAKIEIGGLVEYLRVLKEIAIGLRELATGKMDPEIAKLMKYGYGTVPMDQIVNPQSGKRNPVTDVSLYGQQALSTAKGYLGYSETAQKQDLTDYLNKYSGTVFKDIAGEVNAWCARFVSAVLQQNGIQNPQTASARAFAQFGQSVWKQGDGDKGMENVKPGDIVVFTRGKGGHVAFVDSIDLQKRTMDVLGGNQGNAVSIRRRSFDDPNLMTIRRASAGNDDFFNGKNTQVEKLNAALGELTAIQKMIVQKSIAAGLDPSIMLGLAQRESRFNPNAENRDGGRGLWQFMPSGKEYGLMNEADRKNAEKSTDAAILKFKDLMTAFDGNIRRVLAAWNMGETGVKRRLAKGQDPEQFTSGPHVSRILDFSKQWQAKLSGALPQIMGTGDLQKQNKAFQSVLDDQYKAYTDHLKRLEDERSAYSSVELAQQRTAMDKLEAEREKVRKRDMDAIAMAQGTGNMRAVDQATMQAREHELKFLKDKKELLLKSMDVEYAAIKQQQAHNAQKMREAKGTNNLDAMADLKTERTKILSELKVLEENRKQITINADKEIADSAKQTDSDRRKAMKEAADTALEIEKNRLEGLQATHDLQRQQADDFVAMQRNRVEALQAEFAVQQDLAELSATAFSQYADEQRGAIDLTIERAKAEFEARDAQRQSLMEGKEGIEAVTQARENLNARLQDQLALLQQERDATVQKLELTRQELEYQKRLTEWQLQRTTEIDPNDQVAQLAIKKQLSGIEAEITKNIQEQAKANEKLSREQAKAQGGAMRQGQKIDVQEVSESQLRMNAFWDQYMGRLRDYVALWQEVTGGTEDGWSRMALASGEYAKSVDQISQYWQKASNQQQWGSMAPMVEAFQQGQAAAAMMAKTMLAARENTEKGSAAYNNLTTAAENFMQILQLLNVAEGIAAVLKQLKEGDPYTAAIRAAGVAMMVASMGIQTGLSGGTSGGMSNGQARRASQSGGYGDAGGGVFGDTSTKSESISKSLEIVAQNSNSNLAYSAGMYRSLKNIELSLAGTTNAVIRNVGPQTGLNLKAPSNNLIRGMFDPIGMSFAIGAKVFGDPISKLMAKLSQFLLNTTKKITDWGLAATQQSLSAIMKGGFQGQGFTDVTTTTKVLGITVQKSTKRYFAELNGAVNTEFTRAIVGVANTVAEAGKAFGLGAKDFQDRLKNFVVSFGSISTKGLKGDELQKALAQMFSAMSDDMARAFMPGLDAFMQAGEGYLTTLVRVADGINVATGMLAQAGLNSINYQDIVLKQGDVAAEIIRQSIVAFEGIGSAIGAYIDQAVGSAEELMAVYQDLLTMSDVAKTIGFSMRTLTNDMVVVAGGVNKFLESLQTYQTDILGIGDYASQMIGLNREFKKLGLAVPPTNEAFVKLVDSINTATPAGAKLYAQVMNLAGAFSKAKKAAAEAASLLDKYNTDPMKAYKQRIEDVKTDFAKIIDGMLAGMPGGPDFIAKNQRITTLNNRIDDRAGIRAERQAKLAGVQAEIDVLKAKSNLTRKEKARLNELQAQKNYIKASIKSITDEMSGYQKEIDKLNQQIAKNPKSAELITERNRLLVQQGDALLSTLSDIFDQINQSISNAKDALQGIRDDIYTLSGEVGGPNAKAQNTIIQRQIAETGYYATEGQDIAKRTEAANKYRAAIMGEYEARKAAIEATQTAIEKERDARQKAHDKEIEALQKQLDKVKELNDAVKAIQKYALGMKLGSGSTLSPQDMLKESAKQYQDLLTRAQNGDVGAMQDLSDGATNYLEAARKYYGSGTQYATIFDGVSKAMEQLGAMDPGDADSIQAKIDDLNEAHGKYLDSIDKRIEALKIDEQIQALQLELLPKLQALDENFAAAVEKAEAAAKLQMAELIQLAKDQNILNADQLIALNNLAAAAGVTGYTYQDPTKAKTGTNTTEPTLPDPTDDWVQRIYDEWLKGQTGYKAPPPAFTAAVPSGASMFASVASAPDYATFQPVPAQQGKPINLEVMPRVINDLPREKPDLAKLSFAEVVAELKALKTEMAALVTTQSSANPQLINRLERLEAVIAAMAREQKIKPTAKA